MHGNWIGIESTTAWVLVMLGAVFGVGLIATGMLEDLFEIFRQWPVDGTREPTRRDHGSRV